MRRDLLTNDVLRRVLGKLATMEPRYGIIIESLDGWKAEVYEVEHARRAVSADVFRCNWVDLRSGSDEPLWSGMVQAGVPHSNYELPLMMVQDEDFSRRGFPYEYIVNVVRESPPD